MKGLLSNRYLLIVFLLISVGIAVNYFLGRQKAVTWVPPKIDALGFKGRDSLVRYGASLFKNTSYYLGPKGSLDQISNGMNCQNCHEAAGTKLFSNCLNAVAANYPRYRDRSGRVESISFRINECMERSLNGQSLDTNGIEMQAIIAYLQWLGAGVQKGVRPVGAGVPELPYLERAADPARGKIAYSVHCEKCHTQSGAGQYLPDSSGYLYPPLWGAASFNTGAGMFRISKLAAFIRYNMPFGTNRQNPVLTNEEAWDIAAHIVSQKRPEKSFLYDWKDITRKPVDYPFAPFADSFPAEQHKYGPFTPILAKKKPQ